MATVKAFRIEGLKLVFFTNDHAPPHLHVIRRGEWEIRVFFLECVRGTLVYDRKRGKEPDSRACRAILRAVLLHRERLLEEWSALVEKGDKDL